MNVGSSFEIVQRLLVWSQMIFLSQISVHKAIRISSDFHQFSFDFGWFGRFWQLQNMGSYDKTWTENLSSKVHYYFRSTSLFFHWYEICRMAIFVQVFEKRPASPRFTLRDIWLSLRWSRQKIVSFLSGIWSVKKLI